MDVIPSEMTQERIAIDLLLPLFRCIEPSYKSKYARDIWEHFENGIRSAAYTGSLKTFFTNVKNRLPIDIKSDFLPYVLNVVNSGQDDDVLNWLRDETAYLVLLVRLQNQEHWERVKSEEELTRGKRIEVLEKESTNQSTLFE